MGAGFLEDFSCLFADNVERLFVASQPKEGGMPHLVLTRPLGEFYLAYELGNEPRSCVLGRDMPQNAGLNSAATHCMLS
jgi:hypothetical protein